MVGGRKGAMGAHQQPHKGLTNDWITPKYIIDALGPFDLDPCACIPQPWPCAEKSYTIEDDGLSQEWNGRVWLNPPYGPEASQWLERLAQHGRGTALVFARTETRSFFENIWSKASALLFLEGRLFFHRPGGMMAKANAGAPSVFVAYGDRDAIMLKFSGLPGSFVYGWNRINEKTETDDQ